MDTVSSGMADDIVWQGFLDYAETTGHSERHVDGSPGTSHSGVGVDPSPGSALVDSLGPENAENVQDEQRGQDPANESWPLLFSV